MPTMIQSKFDAYAANIQAKLLEQGYEIVPDPEVTEADAATAKPIFPANGQGNALTEGTQGMDLIDDEDGDESGLWLNVYIVVGGKRFRVTAQSLDSDFMRYADKEHTKPNTLRDNLVANIDKHGITTFNEKAVFEVEFTRAGESSMVEGMDLI